MSGFLVAERRGLISNPNHEELEKLHQLALEVKRNNLQSENV